MRRAHKRSGWLKNLMSGLDWFTKNYYFNNLTTITPTPTRSCRGFTRSSSSQLSGQIDEKRGDTPTPWWADRYHSRAEWNLTHPGEVCLSPRSVLRVCSRQQDRQAATSSLSKKGEKRGKKERKGGWGAGTKRDREQVMEGMVERVKSEMRECPGVEKMTNKLRRGERKKREGKQDKWAEMQQGILGGGENEQGWVGKEGGRRWRHLICSIITKPLVELWTDASVAAQNMFTTLGWWGSLMVQMFRFKGLSFIQPEVKETSPSLSFVEKCVFIYCQKENVLDPGQLP